MKFFSTESLCNLHSEIIILLHFDASRYLLTLYKLAYALHTLETLIKYEFILYEKIVFWQKTHK